MLHRLTGYLHTNGMQSAVPCIARPRCLCCTGAVAFRRHSCSVEADLEICRYLPPHATAAASNLRLPICKEQLCAGQSMLYMAIQGPASRSLHIQRGSSRRRINVEDCTATAGAQYCISGQRCCIARISRSMVCSETSRRERRQPL